MLIKLSGDAFNFGKMFTQNFTKPSRTGNAVRGVFSGTNFHKT